MILHLLALGIALKASADKPPELTVSYVDGATCSVRIGDRKLALLDQREDLEIALKAIVAEAKHVIVRGDIDTPYRCVGALMYVLQVNGATKVEFRTPGQPE